MSEEKSDVLKAITFRVEHTIKVLKEFPPKLKDPSSFFVPRMTGKNSSKSFPPSSKIQVTNRTLTIVLRGMASKSLRDSDIKLAHAEFSYNRAFPMLPLIPPLKCTMALTPYSH